MKQTTLKRKSDLKNYSVLKRSKLKRKVIDFESESPDSPMIVLDWIFSKVIRLKNADERGLVSCYTCGIIKHWKEMQCGHFRPRKHLGTRYEEKNCKVQCMNCNCFLSGNLEEFSYRLSQEYTPNTVQELYNLSLTIISNFPWESTLKSFRAQLSVLVAEQDNNIQY